MPTTLKGNCYLCGKELGKTAMKNHVLKAHADPEAGQKCYLLKIEGAYDKNYWLLADVPLDAILTSVDRFLRKIWLECCGHLSKFQGFGKSRKLSALSVGDSFLHEYDFGTTTETLITVIAETARKKQKEAVRLLARNVPLQFECAACGKPATAICIECAYEVDNPFFCDVCADVHEHDDMLLPVVNSPRMGECGYDGELDTYSFNPDAYKGKI